MQAPPPAPAQGYYIPGVPAAADMNEDKIANPLHNYIAVFVAFKPNGCCTCLSMKKYYQLVLPAKSVVSDLMDAVKEKFGYDFNYCYINGRGIDCHSNIAALSSELLGIYPPVFELMRFQPKYCWGVCGDAEMTRK